MSPTPPPYAPNTVNQTVDYNGVTWKGQPGGDWVPQSYTGGGSMTGDASSDMILASINKQNASFIAKLKEYDVKNPFKYDEILAEEMKKVGQRLDPYYKQTLDDFLLSINRKRTRSLEDERKTLGEISQDTQDYTKENKKILDTALEKSREGYADVGLYSSGARMRKEGQLGYESQNRLTDYVQGQERRAEDVKLSTGRNLEDYGTEQSLFQRDVGQYNPQGVFTRGARSEAETRLQALGEMPRRQQQYEFTKRNYVGAPPAYDQAAYYLDTYNLLR